MSKPTLGAYLIVKNEESCLGKCLKSLKGFDEIVVLDTGSTDKTSEVASKFDCNYISGKYEWQDDFSHARNESMKYSTTDWLLVIDADEIFEGDVERVKSMIQKHPGALSFTVDTLSLNSSSCAHKSVRLHKRDPKVFWSAPAHNYLSVTGDAHCYYCVVKYGYSDAHSLDPDRTLRILSKHVKDNPNCRREKYYLAREYFDRGDYKLAKYYWEWYLENASFGAEMADAHLFIAKSYIQMQQYNKAREHCLFAVNINAQFREAWRLLASLCGPGNRKRFNEIADSSTNETVLFVRGN